MEERYVIKMGTTYLRSSDGQDGMYNLFVVKDVKLASFYMNKASAKAVTLHFGGTVCKLEIEVTELKND